MMSTNAMASIVLFHSLNDGEHFRRDLFSFEIFFSPRKDPFHAPFFNSVSHRFSA